MHPHREEHMQRPSGRRSVTGRSRSGLFWEQEGAGEAGGGWVRSQWESARGPEATPRVFLLSAEGAKEGFEQRSHLLCLT